MAQCELYQAQGRYAEAEPLLRQALLIYEQQLEAPHPNMMVCLNNLAELYRVQGRYGEAEPLLERAVKGSLASLGMKHPQTRQIIANHLTLLSYLHTNGDVEALLQLLAQEKQNGNMGREEL